MLNPEKMREQAQKYIMTLENDKTAYITKSSKDDWVRVSTKRAIEWANAGIDSLEGYSKKEMLEILNSWK